MRAQLAQPGADLKAPDADIKVAPDRLVILNALTRPRGVVAKRTGQALAAQRDPDEHAVASKITVVTRTPS